MQEMKRRFDVMLHSTADPRVGWHSVYLSFWKLCCFVSVLERSIEGVRLVWLGFWRERLVSGRRG
jgi:hypothetical protein